jgi:hypothetical protein
MRLNIGELLLRQSTISPQQLQDALNHQKVNGGKLGRAFVRLGFVRDEEITTLLSWHYGVPSIDLDPLTVDPAIVGIITAETARTYKVLPLWRTGATLTVAMADPTNVSALDDIQSMTGCKVEPVVASESALEDAIELCYGSARARVANGGDADRDRKAEAWVRSERTARQYVTAMPAAAAGGPRTPIRGMVEDVEDMRATLTSERDEARARVVELEAQLERRKSWADPGGTATLTILVTGDNPCRPQSE